VDFSNLEDVLVILTPVIPEPAPPAIQAMPEPTPTPPAPDPSPAPPEGGTR
jgi:hypothetical protein